MLKYKQFIIEGKSFYNTLNTPTNIRKMINKYDSEDWVPENLNTDKEYLDYISDELNQSIKRGIKDIEAEYWPDKIYQKIEKYFEWLALQYINTDLKSEDMYKYAEYLYLFDRYKNRLPQKDIFRYNYRQLIDTVLKFKPYIPLQLDEEAIKTIEEDDEKGNIYLLAPGKLKLNSPYYLLQINNKNASIKYGCNSEWCITRPGNSMWEHYTKNAVDEVFYFLIINGKEKYAYRYARTGVDIYDQSDKSIPVEDFIKKFPFMKNHFKRDNLSAFDVWHVYNDFFPGALRKTALVYKTGDFKLGQISNDYITLDYIYMEEDNEFIREYLEQGDNFDIADLSEVNIRKFLELLNQGFDLYDINERDRILVYTFPELKEITESYLLDHNITSFIESHFEVNHGTLYYRHTFTPKEFFSSVVCYVEREEGYMDLKESYRELIESSFTYKIDVRKYKKEIDLKIIELQEDGIL
jgi:hypothetical protein